MATKLTWTSKLAWRWVIEEVLATENQSNWNLCEESLSCRGPVNSKQFVYGGSMKQFAPAMLRLELTSCEGSFIKGAYCDAQCISPLEDKSDLSKTLHQCECESVAPLTRNFEQTDESWFRRVAEMAVNPENPVMNNTVVLKPTRGCCGHGISFVYSLAEAKQSVASMPKAEESETSSMTPPTEWILQEHVICNNVLNAHKFHIRFYTLLIGYDKVQTILVYTGDYEVRIAPESIRDCEVSNRNAHITNGAGGDATQRTIMSLVPALVNCDLASQVQSFASKFWSGLVNHPAYDSCVRQRNGHYERSTGTGCSFAIAGVDIMYSAAGEIKLLEVNGNPAAPPKEYVCSEFQAHLVKFMSAVMGKVLFGIQDSSVFHEVCAPLDRKSHFVK